MSLRGATPTSTSALVSAGGDQQCGALGQGVVGTGRIAATFGTGAFLLEQIDQLPQAMPPELICGAHALPGTYTLESSMLTCAALYDWCRKLLFPEGLAVMNEEVEESPLDSGGVYVLPFFQGCSTPDWNSAAQGAFAGMSLSTTRGDMARAAWMSAAVTLGLVSDFEEAFSVAASQSLYDPYEPNPAHVECYRSMRARMNELYSQVEGARA